MIKEKTVFILGAGASNPYKYPTAKELKKYICTEFDNSFFVGGNLAQFKKLIAEFSKSPTPSIDLFLSRNPSYHQIGKLIIVYSMAKYEALSTFEPENEEENWYSLIFNEMTNEITKSSEVHRFLENDISFITFNYDRSLEEFMYSSITNTFTELPQDKVSQLLSHIKIHHVYGQYRPASWQKGPPHKGIDKYCDWKEVAKRVNIVGEERESLAASMNEAHKWLKESQRIFFLGFGYAPENLSLLNLNQVLSSEHKIFGTAFDHYPEEIRKIKNRLRPPIIPGIPTNQDRSIIENADCTLLLRKYLR